MRKKTATDQQFRFVFVFSVLRFFHFWDSLPLSKQKQKEKKTTSLFQKTQKIKPKKIKSTFCSFFHQGKNIDTAN